MICSGAAWIDCELLGDSLRLIERDGEPWFVAGDVCKVLGSVNPTQRIKDAALDATEFSTASVGKGRPALIVNESGLYALVMSSRKPEAKVFRKWVTSVVLPAIRRDGSYVMGA